MVLRRGPTKLVQLVIWDRAGDKFKPGPWFKGRIFANRSDVSPDGRRSIYFAMGGLAGAIPATGGTWTAISELPSLKALALWGQGDTRGGGGMFLSNNGYWLKAGCKYVRHPRRTGWNGGHELDGTECKLEFPTWEWAERDRHRLVWAEGGCLKTARLGVNKLGPARTLCDFNGSVG